MIKRNTLLTALLAMILLSACNMPGLTSTSTALPPTPTQTSEPSATIPPTETAQPTETSAPIGAEALTCPPAAPPLADWPVYCQDTYGFFYQYPPAATVSDASNAMDAGNAASAVRIDLPVEPGTNLGEKYLDVIVQETDRACESPMAADYPAEMVERQEITINDVPFLKQSGSDAGAGNYYQWIAYSTGWEGVCVSFDFVLHSTNRMNYPTPPPEFDFDAETAVFEQIVGSFSRYTP